MALSSYMRRHGIALVGSAAGEALPPARLTTLDGVSRVAGPSGIAEGTVVVVVHPGAIAAQAIGTVLCSHGAQVATWHPDDSLDRLHALVPDAILIDATDLHRSCWKLVRALWSHPWLRFVPVLVAPPGSLHTPQGRTWDLQGIDAGLNFLRRDVRQLTASVRERSQLSLELNHLGAARMLRALMESERSLRIRIDTQSNTFHVDVVGPLVFGAYGGPRGSDTTSQWDAPWTGPSALRALLACNEGVVSVQECERLSVANIMAPLGSALHSAATTDVPHGATSGTPPSAKPKSAPPAAIPASASVLTFSAPAPAPRPTTGLHWNAREERTLAGVGAAGASRDAVASVAGARHAARACRRDDHTLIGIGKAASPNTSVQSVSANAQILASVGPARNALLDSPPNLSPPSRPKADLSAWSAAVSKRSAHRDVENTLVGIGGKALLQIPALASYPSDVKIKPTARDLSVQPDASSPPADTERPTSAGSLQVENQSGSSTSVASKPPEAGDGRPDRTALTGSEPVPPVPVSDTHAAAPDPAPAPSARPQGELGLRSSDFAANTAFFTPLTQINHGLEPTRHAKPDNTPYLVAALFALLVLAALLLNSLIA